MNLTYFRSEMRGNVEKNNSSVNIRFIAKTSDIRNLSENITSDVMLKYQKWQHQYQRSRTLVLSRGRRNRTAPLFRHKG